MSRQIPLVARSAAVLVTLVGLYASVRIAGAVGEMQGAFSGRPVDTFQIVPFLVSFLFFGSLATLLWIAADTIDAVDRVHKQVDGAQAELRSLRGQRLDPMTARTVGQPDASRDANAARAPVPDESGAGADRRDLQTTPAGSGVRDTTPAAAIEECAIEQAGAASSPELRAVISGPRGWMLVDYQPLFDAGPGPRSPAPHHEARAEALRVLTDRLVGAGWEPLPPAGPDVPPRFRRAVSTADAASA